MSAVITDPEALGEIADYIDALRAHPFGAQYFAEGWAVALVDLTRVRGFQPSVYSRSAVERVTQVDSADMKSVAATTLPMPDPAPLAVQFDEGKNAFVISSPDLNLRVMGHFGGPINDGQGGPDMTSFGFPVGLLPSLVKVIDFNGASYLNDGYHRTFGLLDRGITAAPAMVRTVDAYEDLNVPAGMLAQGQFLGPRPPLLPDYHNDEVSAEVQLPLMQKTVVIQAIELTQAG